jgi:hypothetical protein
LMLGFYFSGIDASASYFVGGALGFASLSSAALAFIMAAR